MANTAKIRDESQPSMPTLKSLNSLRDFRTDPLQFLAALPRQYGNIVRIQLFIWPTFIINHPDYVRHVLQENHLNYDKNVPIFNVFRPILGNGLVTNYGGESWLQQRRLMQPAFHRQRIAELGTLMTTATQTMLDHWENHAGKHGVIDVAEEMMQLTLNIVSQALFHSDIEDHGQVFTQAFSRANTFLVKYFNRPFPPMSVPTPSNWRFRSELRTLDTVVFDIIRQRRQRGGEYHDLMATLMEARDEESGKGMNDQQLRDEIMTLLIAGHETGANALAWCWYLLAQNPAAEQKLHKELDTVLGNRTPTVDDLPQLPYTRMVFEEAMRLYPPVWILMRKALHDDKIGEHIIPANTYILWSTYALHRHPDFWEEPERFDPERFTPERSANRPRHAYIPFSNGPRLCIGNVFAMVESQLILAMVAQRYHLALAFDQKVETEPLMTLKPHNGIKVLLKRR